MPSFNLRTYEADWGAEFTTESGRASLTYFLEPDADDPQPPSIDNVIDKIKELLGFTNTDVNTAAPPGGLPFGGLERHLPMAHPIYQNFVVANVRVEPVRDEANFEVRDPDPEDVLEA